MRLSIVLLAALLTAACTTPNAGVSSLADPQLSSEIARIRAIDNHAHPVRPTAAGEKPDDEYDALPVDNLEPQSDPLRLRPTSPQTVEARQKLFQGDKTGAARIHAGDYATWILDQLGIDTMLANRVALGPGLPTSRFRWVAFADALMYPLNNEPLLHNSDLKAFFGLEEKLLRRYYSESGLTGKPPTLDEYLEKVVRATLQRHQAAGAVAEKFEMAYLRTLAVGNPSHADAMSVYAQGSGDYKALQDYIFRFIALECGRLGMAVHIHAAAGGSGYFDVGGANPLLVEPLLDDPALRKTNFVMLHGGWPFTGEITPLLTKPNAYVDFSQQTVSNYPRAVSEAIRPWLEFVPEKVMFATDAYPFSPELGWEESAWVATTTGREALALALTGMMRDNEISRERAVELARMVMRENARKLYRLP